VSTHDWMTPMRRLDEHEARQADRLAGQAAADVHDDGRVTITAMPDANCFFTTVTISAADADAFVRVIWAQRLAAVERYLGTEATRIKAILRGPDVTHPPTGEDTTTS
jgi:hypothetical protein